MAELEMVRPRDDHPASPAKAEPLGTRRVPFFGRDHLVGLLAGAVIGASIGVLALGPAAGLIVGGIAGGIFGEFLGVIVGYRRNRDRRRRMQS